MTLKRENYKKYLLLYTFIFIFFLSFFTVNGALSDNIVAYYNFDGDSDDLLGINNGTDSEISYVTESKLGSHSANFTQFSHINLTNMTGAFKNSDGMTICFWTKLNESEEGRYIVNTIPNLDFQTPYFFMGLNTNKFRSTWSPANSNILEGDVINGTWHYFCSLFNDTNHSIILDNVVINNTPRNFQSTNWTRNFSISNSNTAYANRFIGTIDELAIYNRSLSENELDKLWNGGFGLNPVSTSNNLTLSFFFVTPLNNTKINENTSLEYNLNIVNGSANCTLFDNGVEITTMIGLSNDTYFFGFNSSYWEQGDNILNITCNDFSYNQSEEKTLFVDYFEPQIWDINYTEVNFTGNLSNAIIQSVGFKVNISTNDTNNYLINVTITNTDTLEGFFSNESINITESFLWSYDIPFLISDGGNYKLSVTSRDAHTKKRIDFSRHLLETNFSDATIEGKRFDNRIKSYMKKSQVNRFRTMRSIDRKKFRVNFKPDINRFSIFVEGDEKIVYLADKYGYQGHFIIDNHYWFDLENNGGATILNVVKHSDILYEVIMRKNINRENITFNSIGIINTKNINVSFSFRPIGLTNCSLGDVTINFTVKNESNKSVVLSSNIQGAFNYFINGVLNSYSFDVISSNTTVCIIPSTATILTDFQILYTGNDKSFQYYGDDINLSNSAKLIDLFVSGGTTQVLFYVQSTGADNVKDAFITIDKYNVGTNTYTTVEILKTDNSGNAIGNIILTTAFYRFTIIYEGIVRLVDGPTIVTETTKNFVINIFGDDWYDGFTSAQDISGELSFNNLTNNTKLEYEDFNLVADEICLRVDQTNSSGTVQIGYQCVSEPTGEILINIPGNKKDNTYIATATAFIDSKIFTLDVLEINFKTDWRLYDSDGKGTGIFMTFFICLTLIMLGITHPVVAVLLTVAGIGVSMLLGIYMLSMPTFMFLIVMAGVVIWKVNSQR